LSAETEGKTWTPPSSTASTPAAAPSPKRATTATRSLASQRSNSSSGRNSPAYGNSSSGFGSHSQDAAAGGLVSDKERNEAYFSTLGQANESRDA
jgi:ADP-ribosylation factor GTPase-activating protein 1